MESEDGAVKISWSGHGSIEDDFAVATAGGSDGVSAKYIVVGEGENSVGLHEQRFRFA